MVGPHTKLSELKARSIAKKTASVEGTVVPASMVSSIQQSMSIEGYIASERAIIEATIEALNEMNRAKSRLG